MHIWDAPQLKPPGFEDGNKKDEGKYGDFILWKQVLGFATTNPKPIIFVTGDKKSDWWVKKNDKPDSPHPELRREFQEVVKQPFWMYSPECFLKLAKEKLLIEIDPRSIEEANTIANAEFDGESFDEQVDEAIQQESGTARLAGRNPNIFGGSELQRIIEQSRIAPDLLKSITNSNFGLSSKLTEASRLAGMDSNMFRSELQRIIEQGRIAPDLLKSINSDLLDSIKASNFALLSKLVEQSQYTQSVFSEIAKTSESLRQQIGGQSRLVGMNPETSRLLRSVEQDKKKLIPEIPQDQKPKQVNETETHSQESDSSETDATQGKNRRRKSTKRSAKKPNDGK